MQFQVLSDGRLRGEITVFDGGWQLRLPEEGVTIEHTRDGGLTMDCAKKMNRVQVRMRPEVAKATAKNPPCSCGHSGSCGPSVPVEEGEEIMV